jgi:hypothetical protein
MLKEPERIEASVRADLSGLARLLPAIGGTVTEVLEQHLGEAVRATRLHQRMYVCERPLPLLALADG